jgi:hypothetical protein
MNGKIRSNMKRWRKNRANFFRLWTGFPRSVIEHSNLQPPFGSMSCANQKSAGWHDVQDKFNKIKGNLRHTLWITYRDPVLRPCFAFSEILRYSVASQASIGSQLIGTNGYSYQGSHRNCLSCKFNCRMALEMFEIGRRWSWCLEGNYWRVRSWWCATVLPARVNIIEKLFQV